MIVRRLRERASEESGFSLVELLVAAVILGIGIFGLVTSVQTSHKLSDVSEHETVASQVADRELDLALTIPYPSVSLSTGVPVSGAATADATRWNVWLTSGILPHPGTAFDCGIASAGNNNPTLPDDEQATACVVACPSVSAGTGCPALGRLAPVSSASVPTTAGTVQKLKIYRYVTWVNDLACGTGCPNPATAGYKGDYKRVTIAVLPVIGATPTTGVAASQALDGPLRPVVVSAIRNDPTLGAGNAKSPNPSPCGIGGVQC